MTSVALLVPLLVCGCGNDGVAYPGAGSSGGSDSASGGTASGGSEQGAGGDGGETASGGSEQGAGGNGGATEQCRTVDGKLAYGPIGEPYPLSPGTGSNGFGFRTAAGYGFVWGLSAGSDVPGWSLNRMTVDSRFGGGSPQELLTRDSAPTLDVIPVPDGFLAAICSEDSEAEWIRLTGDLEVAEGTSPIKPEAPCTYRQPSILWTGEGYLTYFSDARGLMVALLDQEGAIVREEILSDATTSTAKARFSKNGDRVLVASVMGSGGLARYAVFDLRGKLMGEIQALGEEESFPLDVAIAAKGDGWLVVSDYAVTNKSGLRLTELSRDGLVSREQQQLSGYPSILGFTPSAYGGFLYAGTYYSGGQYGADYKVIALIDDAGEPAYDERADFDTAESWPFAVIDDPERDLVLQSSLRGDSEGAVQVQEYGCLE